jgi:3-deoxy-D-manno-octulosonic-acid transferase
MPSLLQLYETLMRAGTPALEGLLARRANMGKEDIGRIDERRGNASRPRPNGALAWVHAASVGEAQSTLILIDALSKAYPEINVLVTTGTVSSATLMVKRLPSFAFHQFVPIDHPVWTDRFLEHWKPDLVLWMESELWPNLLSGVKRRNIPAALINARLSDRSFNRWKLAKRFVGKILSSFTIIMTQTRRDENHYRALGAQNVVTTSNLKYSSAPLPFIAGALQDLKAQLGGRPVWVYASSHNGEEQISCRVHKRLKETLPNLLTIIVPRHIERRADIAKICEDARLSFTLRGENHTPPNAEDDIYIADTLGELGLFFTLAPIAIIGRSFSLDGGGGHNPIEAAQLNCAVLTGPNVQYQQQMFDDMFAEDAAIQVNSEEDLYETLRTLFTDQDALLTAQKNSAKFAEEKSHVIDVVLQNLAPCLTGLEKKNAA